MPTVSEDKPVIEGSRLAARLAAGAVAVTAELNPPRHSGTEALTAEASGLVGVVDAANVTDGTRALVRMSSVAAAVVVKSAGLEPVVQITCRDRNRIALQSDLLGLNALGIHNALLLTGDDPTQGDHPDAKPVFDLSGTELLAAAAGIVDRGQLLSGRDLAHRPQIFIGAAGDPEKDLGDPEKAAIVGKARAGARFIQTQITFNPDRFRQWTELIAEAGLADQLSILAGVFILDSAKRADFVRNNMFGVVMSDDTFDRIAGADDEAAEGVAMASELVEQLLQIDGVSGVHLMGLGPEHVETKRAVVAAAGLMDR